MSKRIFKLRKRHSINEDFVQDIKRVLSEIENKDIKQKLFEFIDSEFDRFAFRTDLHIHEQIYRVNLLNEILERCGLKEEYTEYRDKGGI